jgi:hypothetical protein
MENKNIVKINPGPGYGFDASGNGFNINISATPVDDTFGAIFGVNLPEIPNIPNIPYVVVPQFQCFVVPGTGGYAGKSILTIASGGVNYTNSNMPNISEGVTQNNAEAFITKVAVQSDGVIAVPSITPITPLTPFMENNGFFVLNNPSDKYYVVLSYYDGNGDNDEFNIPILTLRTPWVSIVKEGSPEYNKLFVEQGPSYYTGLLNIAPMIDYSTTGTEDKKYFGHNHTCYFNPVKFGANIKIISVVQNNAVNQYLHGSQNLTIPLLNHGTQLMYVPGMNEVDDPFYTVTSKDSFNAVVNKSDITALSSLSFTGGWWNQVTDNVTPRTVTINNYSYYSLNYEGTDNMREFTCSVYGLPAGDGREDPTHRLRVKSGLVTFKTSSANPDTGIITYDPVITNLRINEANIYPQGKKNDGTDDNPDYIHKDGYIELDEGSDYYVFIYKVTPNFSGDSSCKAPQLVVSKIDGTPNTKIKTIGSGGGQTTAYILIENPTAIDVVTANPETGKIGEFDPAELNDHIKFHAENLTVERNNTPADRTAYPASMLGWLNTMASGLNSVPVFAKKSVDNYPPSGPDQMTVDNVPSGCGFRDYYVIGQVSVPPGGGDALFVTYNGGDDDCGNGIVNNVIVGWDVGGLYGYTQNPIVSGIIDTSDFKIGMVDPGGPGEPTIVEFDSIKIDLIANNITSLSALSKDNIKDKGIGYVKTDCYRKDIAYLKWDSEGNRFIVRQLHTGPVVLEDTPIHVGNTIVELESEIGWDSTGGTTPTEEIVGASFPGYTQALNDGSTNQYDGSTDPINYLPTQPSQIESPNGEPLPG